MLAMVVNDNVGCLIPRGVLATIASMLAPTGAASWSRQNAALLGFALK
jgi:hypothetical protein